MQTHFEAELSDLKQTLLTMGSHAETALREATEALVSRNTELALSMRAKDDVLDNFEIEVDEAAIQLLAKAPLASDLRLITVAMKISHNLERVGDEASKIAKRAHELSQEPPLPQVRDIPPLAELATRMLRQALDAFVRLDAPAARALIPEDKEVDESNRRVCRDLVRQMEEDPETISRALHLMVAAKSLERIADHAKNIAEEVVYLCEAEDIRHSAQTRSQI